MKFRLTVVLLACLPLWGACTSTGPGAYRCASTGNPDADGVALWNLLNDKAFPCGSTITLDAGASYTTPVLYQNYSYAFRWKPQAGCAPGAKTQIVSSRLNELPEAARVGWTDRDKTAKLVAKGGPPGGGGLVLDIAGAANNWALRGITLTTGPGVAAGGGYGSLLNRTFDISPTSKMSDFARDIEIERCFFTNYEEETYGPMETATTQAAFFRGVGIGAVLDGTNITVKNSMFKGIGGFYPSNPVVVPVSSATQANPAIVTAPGIAAAFGLAPGGRALGVFGGATGNWPTLNGAKSITYVSADSVRVYMADAYYALEPKPYDGTGKGLLTGAVSIRRGQQIDPTYAILAGAVVNFDVTDNFIESWSMPIFTGGGNYLPTNYTGIVQTGSTASSIILDNVTGLRAGDLMMVPAAGRSIYCTGSNWNCTYGGSRVGKVTAINGNTATIAPIGPQGIDVPPTVGGQTRWRGNQIENFRLKRNTIFRSDGLPLNGKGFIELKVCFTCLLDGNTMLDSAAGNWFLTSRNQAGRDPWSTGSGTIFSNNLVGGPNGSPPRLTLLGEDNENTSTVSENVWYQNNLLPGIRFPNASSGTGTMSIMDYGNGIKSGGWLHNTAIAKPVSAPHIVHYAGDYCRTSPARYGFGDNIRLSDNLMSYGEGLNTSSYPCLPGFDVKGNLFWVDGSKTIAEAEKSWPGNHAIATLTAAPLVGACDWEHWENCRLAPNSPYRGTASDGGDPGADIDQLKDHLNGWSEKAGLIDAWNLNRAEAIRPAGTRAVLDFRLISQGDCTVELYTDRNRGTLHADSANKACNRAGNTVDAAHVVATLGSVAPLTPSTEYFYKITQGPALMVGAFKTTGDTPPIPPQTDQLLESRVAGLEAEAITQRNALSNLEKQAAQLSDLLNQAIIAIKTFAKSLEAAAAGLSTNPPPTQ